MTLPTPLNAHADLVSQLIHLLSTRTLNHFADEARQDGESLREAIERYDIDYAWHVLGSQRLRDAAVAALEIRLGHELTEPQRGEVAGLLNAAAARQASDLLMSFDNDLVPQLVELMTGAWAALPSAQAMSADPA